MVTSHLQEMMKAGYFCKIAVLGKVQVYPGKVHVEKSFTHSYYKDMHEFKWMKNIVKFCLTIYQGFTIIGKTELTFNTSMFAT